MPNRDAIAQQALMLSPEDRTYLVEILEASLDPGPFATPEVADAWSTEIDRRIAAYDRGETQAIDVEAAFEHIREALRKQDAEDVEA